MISLKDKESISVDKESISVEKELLSMHKIKGESQ